MNSGIAFDDTTEEDERAGGPSRGISRTGVNAYDTLRLARQISDTLVGRSRCARLLPAMRRRRSRSRR